jgi:hypothetical protein
MEQMQSAVSILLSPHNPLVPTCDVMIVTLQSVNSLASKYSYYYCLLHTQPPHNFLTHFCFFGLVSFLLTCIRKWDASADYMFFRENVPSETKLSRKMENDSFSVAYACQCKWQSIQELTLTQQISNLKWSCAGHF